MCEMMIVVDDVDVGGMMDGLVLLGLHWVGSNPKRQSEVARTLRSLLKQHHSAHTKTGRKR